MDLMDTFQWIFSNIFRNIFLKFGMINNKLQLISDRQTIYTFGPHKHSRQIACTCLLYLLGSLDLRPSPMTWAFCPKNIAETATSRSLHLLIWHLEALALTNQGRSVHPPPHTHNKIRPAIPQIKSDGNIIKYLKYYMTIIRLISI